MPTRPSFQAPASAVHDRATKVGVAQAIMVHSLATGRHHKLIEGEAGPRYSETGHLVFVRGATVVVTAFRADTLEVSGPLVTTPKGQRFRRVPRRANRVLVGAAVRRATGLGRSPWLDRTDRRWRPAVRPPPSITKREPTGGGFFAPTESTLPFIGSTPAL